ncbi:MAG: XTP/dITP diphosphatase [Oscillospiraceae bacterium]|nr:XTP/dITP diphosphatase [Oscillospiraceae bacterium]MBR6835752.1 XTP/dITP diphosphatase [Oscillospiraceae bacterium]
MKVILASNNKHKLEEIKKILTPLGYEVVSQAEAGVDIDVEETGTTFEENAALKAQAVYDLTKTAVISDDSGLEVDYLNGAPGVYSHRYAGENATDADRCAKLLSELNGVETEKRTARFVCVLCFIDDKGEKLVIRGTVEGIIGTEPKGENGFGYDPVFMYGDRSFAELSAEEKNSVSHRADALKKFAAAIGAK